MDSREEILQLVRNADPANPLDYVHDIVRGYAREKLDTYIRGCTDCDICSEHRTSVRGNSNATVLIIGESPSEDQVSSGELLQPFANQAGGILDSVFGQMGINQDQLFYINAVSCWPHKVVGDEVVSRTPHKKEVEACSVFVNYAIQLVQPLVIVLLGGIALNLFKKDSITAARGQWLDVKGIPTMPTYHPGYFLKIEGKKDPEIVNMQKWEFYNDLRKAFMYVYETYPDNSLINQPIPTGE